jgi:hypothetical protein
MFSISQAVQKNPDARRKQGSGSASGNVTREFERFAAPRQLGFLGWPEKGETI